MQRRFPVLSSLSVICPQVSSPASLSLLSSLLEVSPGELEDALTGRVIAAHGDVVRKLHSVEDAQRARDAFTKVSF